MQINNVQVSKLLDAVTVVLKAAQKRLAGLALEPVGAAAICNPNFADFVEQFDAKVVPMRAVSSLHSLLDGGKMEKISLEVGLRKLSQKAP